MNRKGKSRHLHGQSWDEGVKNVQLDQPTCVQFFQGSMWGLPDINIKSNSIGELFDKLFSTRISY